MLRVGGTTTTFGRSASEIPASGPSKTRQHTCDDSKGNDQVFDVTQGVGGGRQGEGTRPGQCRGTLRRAA